MASKKFANCSVIVTVCNEVKTVEPLLKALAGQTLLPESVIITDGGSIDGTWKKLQALEKQSWPFAFVIKQVKGNRSVGRNSALRMAKTTFVASTDAGCIPEQTWIEELLATQKQSNTPVVAGYYKGLPTTPFETAVVPYVLVMPDRIDEKTFLPATRSALFDRKWLLQFGGFDETLSDNEDYVLARQIQAAAEKSSDPLISFSRRAVVGWQPRATLKSFAWMIFRFARGDAAALALRPKVILIFLRYALFFALLLAAVSSLNTFLLLMSGLTMLLYSTWSIRKNYRYAQNAWHWLPVLQVVSDVAVIVGTIAGLAQ